MVIDLTCELSPIESAPSFSCMPGNGYNQKANAELVVPIAKCIDDGMMI
ncbi:hypothetical protein [Pragia fontium]|nr:hypothetical protein [Pragia fontium]